MTKPQESSEANWKVTSGTKSTYTTFYLILLILLTISTAFGLLGLGSIDQNIEAAKNQSVIAYLTLAQHAVTVIMAVGLIFLYKKQKKGLVLVISGYSLAIVFSLLFLFFKDPLIQDLTRQITASENREVTPEMIRQITTTILTVVPILNSIGSALFGTLWYVAWKKQVAYDTANINKKSTSVNS